MRKFRVYAMNFLSNLYSVIIFLIVIYAVWATAINKVNNDVIRYLQEDITRRDSIHIMLLQEHNRQIIQLTKK